jgi:hypothetical protein
MFSTLHPKKKTFKKTWLCVREFLFPGFGFMYTIMPGNSITLAGICIIFYATFEQADG